MNKNHKKVVLLNLNYDPPVGCGYLLGQHMGLSYIASALRSIDCEVRIIDCVLRYITVEHLVEILKKENKIAPIDCLGLSITQGSYKNVFDLQERLKSTDLRPLVVAGGHFVSQNAEEMLEDCELLDVAIIGEGEKPFCNIMNKYTSKCSFENISNIVWKNEKKEIVTNPLLSLINDLDDYELRANDDRDYLFNLGINDVTLLSSRGCYGDCSFCSNYYRMFKGRCWRTRDVQSVIDEVKEVLSINPEVFINFQNENFFGAGKSGKAYVKEICDELIIEGIKVKFSIFARVNDLNKEIVTLLKQVGCDRIFIGVESINESSLEVYMKHINKEIILETIQMLEECAMKYQIGFIFFEPYQNYKEFLDNIAFFKSNLKNKYNVTVDINDFVVPLRKTSLYEKVKKDGLLISDSPTVGYELNYRFVDSKVQKVSDIYLKIMKSRVQLFLLKHNEDDFIGKSIMMLKLNIIDTICDNRSMEAEEIENICIEMVDQNIAQMNQYLRRRYSEILSEMRNRK